MKKITRKPKAEMRVLSVRVPLPLFEELQAFREALQAFDDTMIFNVNDLMVTALKRDLRVAWEELESLKKLKFQQPAVMQTTADLANTVPPSAMPSSASSKEVQLRPQLAETLHQQKSI